MRKSTRNLLFLFFTLLFLILAPALISYSQGYRIDWDQKTVVQTGAFLIEPRPAPVDFYINGKFKKRTNFVFQNIFVGNLIPKKYLVEIKKQGYFTWKKKLKIAPKLVTEAGDVILFYSSPRLEEISINIKHFSSSPTGRFIAAVKNEKTPTVVLYDTKQNDEKLILKTSDKLLGAKITNILWSKDEGRILFSLEKFTSTDWIVVDIRKDKPRSYFIYPKIRKNTPFSKYASSFYKPIITGLKWSPTEASTIFFTLNEANPRPAPHTKSLLFSYNISSAKLSEPLSYDVSSYALSGKTAAFVSSLVGTLNFLDLENKSVRQATFSETKGGARAKTRLIFVSEEKIIAVVQDTKTGGASKDVYVYIPEQFALKKIAGNINKVRLSGDNKRLLLRGENTIYVYWLEDVRRQPFRSAGDKSKIYETEEAVLSAVWFGENNKHLIFSTKSGIYVLELDGRDKRNVYKIFDKSSENMSRNKSSRKLFIVSENNLYSLSIN